jgi:hypothetical protein
VSEEKKRHVPFPEEENGAPKPPDQTNSYTMVDPRFREIYFQFYKETYKPSVLDRKTKELVATREEISESIAIAIGVNAAAIVDLTDIAAENMNLKLY